MNKLNIAAGLLTVVMILLGGCSSGGPELPVSPSNHPTEGENVLRITSVSLGSDSRAVDAFPKREFEEGDSIGLFVYDDTRSLYASNCANVAAYYYEGKWVIYDQIIIDSGRPATVLAYYPYSRDYRASYMKGTVIYGEEPGSVDILSSNYSQCRADGSVALQFRHTTVKLQVTARKSPGYTGEGVIDNVWIQPNPIEYLEEGEYVSSDDSPLGFTDGLIYLGEPESITGKHLLFLGTTFRDRQAMMKLSDTPYYTGVLYVSVNVGHKENPKRSFNIIVSMDSQEYVVRDLPIEKMLAGEAYTYNVTVGPELYVTPKY